MKRTNWLKNYTLDPVVDIVDENGFQCTRQLFITKLVIYLLLMVIEVDLKGLMIYFLSLCIKPKINTSTLH